MNDQFKEMVTKAENLNGWVGLIKEIELDGDDHDFDWSSFGKTTGLLLKNYGPSSARFSFESNKELFDVLPGECVNIRVIESFKKIHVSSNSSAVVRAAAFQARGK